MTTESPQEEVMELIQPPQVEEVIEDPVVEAVIEEPKAEEVEPLEVDEEKEIEQPPEIDKKSDTYIAGQKAMQAKMQEAFNSRVNKEVGKRKAMETDFNSFKQEMTEFKKSMYKAPEAPKFEDFQDEESPEQAFVQASIKHHSDLNPSKINTPAPIQPTVEQISFGQQEQEYAAKNPTYLEDVENLQGYMRDENFRAAIFSAHPSVAHVLAYNLGKADELSKMTPVKMGLEIGKIEMSVKKGKPLPKKAKPKPEPISESRGGAGGHKDISTMSQPEYNKYMKEQGY